MTEQGQARLITVDQHVTSQAEAITRFGLCRIMVWSQQIRDAFPRAQDLKQRTDWILLGKAVEGL